MSRNFLPAVLAIGVGVFTGYYTFQPALRELQTEKASTQLPPPVPNTSSTQISEKDAWTSSTKTGHDPQN
ncbi:hypothetical protein ASPZODRAFT_132123 [Penicilliopsis zonata CBS 506.65]|uniref:Uncharacterized protein n=1 Tax=Penicilliopsis zonata CBS 506.65 TaxID=1073090 RepID=A0A1L9SIX6_9EURO|nr:hypothetical protein ASPZODRAFT_132123 [Penicilliopsis zonata CBS 506.65]OJJ47169.1 hypothetical protein ASPZODRAFT_132123 [Penicilliopsis zonata CBS 506.65]